MAVKIDIAVRSLDPAAGAADAIARHVGLECLIDLNGLHQISGNQVQFDQAYA
jgi:hypothetical protein